MILSAVYAYPPLPQPLYGSVSEAATIVAKVEDYVARMLKAALPGNYLVDFLPWMMYVPEWFPGATWKREGYAWFRKDTEMFMGLLRQTEDALVLLSLLDTVELSSYIPPSAEEGHAERVFRFETTG